jgi:hypothetical protein
MKNEARIRLLGLALLAWICCAQSHAQPYSLKWYKVFGGAGTSASTAYSLKASTGQQDAGGPITNSLYSVTGGFWSLFANQPQGTPLLSINFTGTNSAQIYWPSPSTGFHLQVNASLTTTNWAAAAESVTNNGVIKFIIVNPTSGTRFYRLASP